MHFLAPRPPAGAVGDECTTPPFCGRLLMHQAAGMAGMYQSAAPTASVLVALAVLMPERVFYGFV